MLVAHDVRSVPFAASLIGVSPITNAVLFLSLLSETILEISSGYPGAVITLKLRESSRNSELLSIADFIAATIVRRTALRFM